MIIVTTETIPGREVVKALGVARGSSVRARHIGRDITAAFKNIIGGEVSEYTKLMADSRENALARLETDAAQMGADAVVNLRFETSTIQQGAAEILAYGTAVVLNELGK